MFPRESPCESHSFEPKAEAKRAGSANNDADETPTPPISAEYSKLYRSLRYTLWRARRVRFCHTFSK